MKKRMITYSVILGFLIISLLFGTFALIKAETFKRNTVSFKVADAGAYCKVEADYFVGQNSINTNNPTKVYRDSYTQVEEYGKTGKTLDAWNIGNTAFVVDEDNKGQPTENDVSIMMFKIKIYNLNTDGKPLGVNLSGIACCNVDNVNTNYFSTKVVYVTSAESEVIAYSNEDDATIEQKQNFNSAKKVVNDINNLIIPSNGNLELTITFKRRTKTDPFEIKNNINFDIFVVNN